MKIYEAALCMAIEQKFCTSQNGTRWRLGGPSGSCRTYTFLAPGKFIMMQVDRDGESCEFMLDLSLYDSDHGTKSRSIIKMNSDLKIKHVHHMIGGQTFTAHGYRETLLLNLPDLNSIIDKLIIENVNSYQVTA